MSYNVKELENLSQEEQIKFLIKTLESVNCSNQDCTNDTSNGKWGVIAHKKYCDKCYNKEKRKEEEQLKKRQQELHRLVEYYEYYLKVVDAIKNLRIELKVTDEEFHTLTDPLKFAFEEANKSQGNNIKSSHSNVNKQPQKQQKKSQHAQEERTKGASPNKQSTPHTQQRTEENTPKKVSKPRTQQHKEETTSVIRDESGKQKKNQNQPSSIDQVKEKVVQLKDPIPASSKEKQQETQNSTTQFVAEVNSKIVYGEKEKANEALEQNVAANSLEENKSTEDDYSLFQLEPENIGDGEYNDYNQGYTSPGNSNFQEFQDTEYSSVSQAISQEEDTEKTKINFTGIPGFNL